MNIINNIGAVSIQCMSIYFNIMYMHIYTHSCLHIIKLILDIYHWNVDWYIILNLYNQSMIVFILVGIWYIQSSWYWLLIRY